VRCVFCTLKRPPRRPSTRKEGAVFRDVSEWGVCVFDVVSVGIGCELGEVEWCAVALSWGDKCLWPCPLADCHLRNFSLSCVGWGARRRRRGGGPGEGCARRPVGTYLYLHAVGVGNPIAVPCLAR
jgi:hypothetical protein